MGKKFDLTNKNISDTFQNLIQMTGSGNHLFDLHGNPVIDLTVSGSIHAQSYIVSESIVSVSSGSTIFGNSADDTHQFWGDAKITGSVIVSASGYLTDHKAAFEIHPSGSYLDYGLLITGSTYNGIPLALIQTDPSYPGEGEFIFGKGNDGSNAFRIQQGAGGSGAFKLYTSQSYGNQIVAHEFKDPHHNNGNSWVCWSEYSTSLGAGIPLSAGDNPSTAYFGVGTKSPQRQLHVCGSAWVTGDFKQGIDSINMSSIGGHITASGNISASGDLETYRLKVGDNVAGSMDGIVVTGDISASGDIYVGGDGGSYGQVAMGDYVAGNVHGIAVKGDISASGDLFVNNISASGTISASGDLWVDNGQVFLGDYYNNNSATLILTDISNDRSASLIQGPTLTSLKLNQDSSQDFSIDTQQMDKNFYIEGAQGNVGIKCDPGSDWNDKDFVVAGDISASGNIFLKDNNEIVFDEGATGLASEVFIRGGSGMISFLSGSNSGYATNMFTIRGTAASYEIRVGVGNSNPPKALTVKGDISASGYLSTESHITASGNISASGNLIGNNVGDISADFIPILATDFQSSNNYRYHLITSNNGASYMPPTLTACNYMYFAEKIIPRGFSAISASFYGDRNDMITIYSSSLMVDDQANVGGGAILSSSGIPTAADDTGSINITTNIVGDGQTSVILRWDPTFIITPSEMFGGKVFIKRS